MIRRDVNYERAARLSAHLLNHCWDLDLPKCEIFGRILFAILAELDAASSEAHEARTTFSDN